MDETRNSQQASCPTDEDGRRDPAKCGGGCAGCGGNAQPPEDGLTGLRFIAPAIVAFMLPLAAAVSGSLLGGAGNGRVIGAVVGLLVGLVLAVVLGKVLASGRAHDNETNLYQVDTSEHIEKHGDSNSHKRQANL